MTGYGDDASSLRINLAHMPIYLGWSGSVSRLGNKPIRTLILDELDKYKNPKNEASSESLAEKRTTTWRTRRLIFKLSTPTTEDGPIWTALTQEAGARFDYWVRCPHCHAMQYMDFGNISWPDKDTEKEPDAEGVLAHRLAYYPCKRCGAAWGDADRDRAVRHGEWRERRTGLELSVHLKVLRPVKVGFHIPAWLSFFVSLSEVAAAALKYKRSGKLDDLKNLQNQYKAEPWKEEHAARSEDTVLALCDDRPRGAVPGPLNGRPRVACLLAGVDTQQTHFRYVIRAFGFGDTEESWLVQSGVAPSFSSLNELLWQSVYRDPDGREYRVRACMIDAMGTRTREVYGWAIRHRGRVFPWQGVRSLSQPYTPAPQEYFPDLKGNKVKIPGGLNLWRCDTTFFKSDLSHKLSIAPEDPGAFHLHSGEGGILEQYAREMCAEIWDDKKQAWDNPHEKDNHYWDCETQCLALAYILNVRHLSPEPAEKKKPAMPVRQPSGMSMADRLARVRR
jgi:phage terminase large subunit GpA-like protein